MKLLCDRCLRDVAVLVPWTRDLDSGRVLMRCCLDCEAEFRLREKVTADSLANERRWATLDADEFDHA